MTPLEFLDHLAALIPPPRKNRHRYHRMLARHSPVRAAVTAYAGSPMYTRASPHHKPWPRHPTTRPSPPVFSPARYLWAVLVARIDEVLPLIRPVCGSATGLIAAVTAR